MKRAFLGAKAKKSSHLPVLKRSVFFCQCVALPPKTQTQPIGTWLELPSHTYFWGICMWAAAWPRRPCSFESAALQTHRAGIRRGVASGVGVGVARAVAVRQGRSPCGGGCWGGGGTSIGFNSSPPGPYLHCYATTSHCAVACSRSVWLAAPLATSVPLSLGLYSLRRATLIGTETDVLVPWDEYYESYYRTSTRNVTAI